MGHQSETVVLVDGSSYLFRAYYALPPLTNSQGMPTGAIYGVANMLRKLREAYNTSRFIVVFDPKGKTVRHTLYPEYKANRAKMPEDLAVQIPRLFDLIRALGMPLVIQEGQEADDVIGTLATQARQAGYSVVISTGDKDMAQLVNDQVTLINTMTDKTLDRDAVLEKFGVPPELIIDYLSLIGDTVDNVPGVPKVGPKTAVKWLQKFGSLDEVMARADEVTGKVGENLRAALPDLPLSRQLVTIDCELELNATLEELVLCDEDVPVVVSLLQSLEFTRWLSEYEQVSAEPVKEKKPADVVLTKEAMAAWIARLEQATAFAFDTETTGLDAMQVDLVGISLAVADGASCYIPFLHDYEQAPLQLDRAWVLQQLADIFADTDKIMVGQNLKYDIKVMQCHGVTIENILWDTMLAAYAIRNDSQRYDLDTLALNYLNESTIKFTDIAGKGAKQLTFNQIDLEQAAPYAAEDAAITYQLYELFLKKFEAQPYSGRAFEHIDMPLLPVLINMEYQGVLLDSELLQRQSDELSTRIELIQQEIYTLAGEEFNIASTKQLQIILFDKLQLPVLKKTAKGQASTAEAVLQELAHDYPLPQLILEFRSLSKLKSTYTDKLPQQVNPRTGRVHTHYHQVGTSTGRLSSSDPNLQNIPIRTAEGRRVRDAFIARPGFKVVAADYSQVELRLMAHLACDPGLIEAFAQQQDVHAATASQVFEVPLNQVTDDQRRSAKAINFGLLYGMSSFGLAQQLGVSRQEAQQFIDIYFEKYPVVLGFMDKIRELAAKDGYVETLTQRRILMPGMQSKNAMVRKAAERAAINAPLQGSAADIIKLAMIAMTDWLAEHSSSVVLVMQVHDELVFEVADDFLDEALEEIRRYMEQAMTLSVPLLVDIGVGECWGQAH